MSDHSHQHHNHNHQIEAKDVNTSFIIGITLNLLFVFIEAGYGLICGSLSLVADAGHNLADVASLALSLLAFKLVQVKPNKQYTYGYRKTSVIVALFNSLILLFTIAVIIYEAVVRLFEHEVLPGKTIAVVAGAGIVINSVTAWLFLKNKEKDINIKSAYLHLLADALVSAAIVIGGIIIIYTRWYWIDSVLSLIVAAVILLSTWQLLKDSLRLSLDGVPPNVNIEAIEQEARKVPGVKDLHHIHIWAMSSTENALTAHIVLENTVSTEREAEIKFDLRHRFEHQNIVHVTLETEREQLNGNLKECHIASHHHHAH